MFIYKQKFNKSVYTWQQTEVIDTITNKVEDLVNLYNQLDTQNERLVVLGFGRGEDINLFLNHTIEVYQLIPRAHKYLGHVNVKDNLYSCLQSLSEHNFTCLERGEWKCSVLQKEEKNS